MKKVVFLFGLLLFSNYCFASEELSKQAVAFYSDNNSNKAMDLLLQIEEKNRTPQDWLILGNLLEENGEKANAIYMYQKAIALNNANINAIKNAYTNAISINVINKPLLNKDILSQSFVSLLPHVVLYTYKLVPSYPR